ncbi:MAG: hypothetical protein EXR59_02660 [Dehalococcoidia bacterium]|nr:hypothetical protein [Dehalococcoidia bacterium]
MAAKTIKKEKTFSLHWGTGVISEEAKVEGEHHIPTFQLLKYMDGPAKGTASIRFCYYSHDGRFQRSPLMMSDAEIEGMGNALKKTPEIRALLKKMLA